MINRLRRCLAKLLHERDDLHPLSSGDPRLSRPSDAIQLILSNFPAATCGQFENNRDQCRDFLYCAVPMIYGCRPKGHVATYEWLSDQLSSVALVETISSRKGSQSLKAPLEGWFMRVPGASKEGLKTGCLPSVFHGKCRSLTQGVFIALENISYTKKTC